MLAYYPNLTKLSYTIDASIGPVRPANYPALEADQKAQLMKELMRILKFAGGGAGIGGLGGLLVQLLRKPADREYLKGMLAGGAMGGVAGGSMGHFGFPHLGGDFKIEKRLAAGDG